MGVNHPEGLVALGHRIHNDPERNGIVHLFIGDFLGLHLPPDRVQMLGPSSDFTVEAIAPHLSLKRTDHPIRILLPIRAFYIDLFDKVVIFLRMQISETQVLKLRLQPDTPSLLASGA